MQIEQKTISQAVEENRQERRFRSTLKTWVHGATTFHDLMREFPYSPNDGSHWLFQIIRHKFQDWFGQATTEVNDPLEQLEQPTKQELLSGKLLELANKNHFVLEPVEITEDNGSSSYLWHITSIPFNCLETGETLQFEYDVDIGWLFRSGSNYVIPCWTYTLNSEEDAQANAIMNQWAEQYKKSNADLPENE